MTGITSPDNLPYPNDYNQPADVPAAVQSLAVAVQAALNGLGAEYAAKTHTHSNYALTTHNHNTIYAPISHTHTLAQVGIARGTWVVGTLTAGQEVQTQLTVPSGDQVLATVNHASTYIFVVAEMTSATTCLLQCRNSTQGTTHTNVKVTWIVL